MLKSGTQSMYWGRKYAKMDERRMPKTISTVLPTLRGIVPIEGGARLKQFLHSRHWKLPFAVAKLGCSRAEASSSPGIVVT
jgi:hypothetical protein